MSLQLGAKLVFCGIYVNKNIIFVLDDEFAILLYCETLKCLPNPHFSNPCKRIKFPSKTFDLILELTLILLSEK